jgi:hypothetical protein
MVDEVTALIARIPEADPVVERHRVVLDSGAAAGVPSHITVLYPFMPYRAIGSEVVEQLAALFASIDTFDFALTSIGWFGQDVVYLQPEPDDPFRRMTTAVAERWSQWPPYEGAHPDPTPHLTIGDNGDVAAMARAAETVGKSLPLGVTVSEIQLFAGTDQPGSWRHRLTFPLRP